MNSSITMKDESDHYKIKYAKLKRKLKNLIYENELYRDELQRCQYKLVKLNRDQEFLLDRLLQYETAQVSSDSEATDCSDTEQRRRTDTAAAAAGGGASADLSPTKKRKTAGAGSRVKAQLGRAQQLSAAAAAAAAVDNGHMTPEQVERHLESRAALKNPDMVAERAPPTVPRQLFSTEDAEWDARDSLETTSNLDEEGLVIDFPE